MLCALFVILYVRVPCRLTRILFDNLFACQLMAVGPRGQNGRLVLSHVVEGLKRELVHVPTHCHNMEVPFVVVM